MNAPPPIIERAFQLAESGLYADIKAIRTQLSREPYISIDFHLASRVLAKQLRALIIAARAGKNS